MIFFRSANGETRHLIVERLESRCLLSADFPGLDIHIDRPGSGQLGKGDNHFPELRSQDHHADVRRRDVPGPRGNDVNPIMRDQNRGREPRNQLLSPVRAFNDNLLVIPDRWPPSTVVIAHDPVVVLAPARTVIVSIVSVPASNIAFPARGASELLVDSSAGPTASARQQPSRSTGGPQPVSATRGDATEAADDEAVTAKAPEVDSATTNGTTLVSRTPVVRTLDRVIVVSGTRSWNTNSFDALFSQSADIDDSEIGRWLNHVDQMNDSLSDLDRALEEIARERSQAIGQTSGKPIRSAPQSPQSSTWLNHANGIFLLTKLGHDQAAGEDDADQGNVLAEGWTVGIGFHRALEIAKHESYSEPLLGMIEQPVESGAIRVSSDETKDDQVSQWTTTNSASQLLGIAICVVGIHYLRVRNQERHECPNHWTVGVENS